MKTQLLCSSLLLVMALSACKTAQVQLKTNHNTPMDVYPVEGRNDWRWKRKVTFGEYTASNFRGGWVGSYEFPFFLRFRGSKEKISFVQHDQMGGEAKVLAVDRFRTAELPLVKDYFNLPVVYKQNFAGTVYLPARQQHYDFWLNFPDANTPLTRTEGFILTPQGKVTIEGIQQLEGMSFKLPGNLGYNFIYAGEVVASVDAMAKGTVYLKKELDSEMKLVLVAVANGILQRTK